MSASSRRALVTGVTGQDGPYLCELLLAEGYEVHGLVMPGELVPAEVPAAVQLHEGLLTDSASLQAAIAARPHEIYNLAAAEFIEADLWQQYAELGGVTPGHQNSYQLALQRLDSDGSQYISSNTLDEQSHASFLNAYLIAKGQEPVDLDVFRTLPSSQATGAQQIGRLTNLMQLSVDTSWYVRYRSTTNPDFGATFEQALPQLAGEQFTGIPRTNDDFGPAAHIQAIANTAAFHFASIEQGGSSLYSTLAQKVS